MQQNKCHIFVLSSKLLFYYLFIEHQASVGGSGKNSKIKVYVMGLHFCTCHTRKIPRTTKVGRGNRPSLIWLSKELLNSAICKSEKYLILLLNCMTGQLSCQLLGILSTLCNSLHTRNVFCHGHFAFKGGKTMQILNSNGSIQNCAVSKTPVGRQQRGQKEIA